MQIHYLATSELISDAANAVHVMRMSAALASSGGRVTLHALCGSGTTDEIFEYYGSERNFSILRYDPNQKKSVRFLLSLRRARLPVGPIARLLHGYISVRNAIPAAHSQLLYSRNREWLIACLREDSRFIYETHSPPSGPLDRAVDRILFRHRGFLGLVVTSKPLRAAYLSSFPNLSPTQVLVAPDAADAVAWESTPSHSSGRFQVGYVGHLYAGRGGELMIELARLLPEADFHLVGGRAEDIDYLKGFGPPKNLTFHGHRPPADLASYYQGFDAVLAPYQRRVAVSGGSGNTAEWMSPLKLFEYMSWGKPIIASDLPVLHEVLQHEQTALLVAPDDAAAWARALRHLMDRPQERATMGQNAHQSFLENYTWKGRASRIWRSFVHDEGAVAPAGR